MRDILALVKPTPEAHYAVFYSLANGADGGRYYDVHKIENMRHELTILAYEMNGKPLSVLHGTPLRLRCENELGFKMVKWIVAIEFVHDLGAGQGGRLHKRCVVAIGERHEQALYRWLCRGDPLRDHRRIGRRDFPARRRRNNMIVAHPLRMNRMGALNAK